VTSPESQTSAPAPTDAASSFEHEFFASARTTDGVDPELERLGSGPSWFTPALLLLVMAFTAYLGWGSRAEFVYALRQGPALDLGMVEEWRTLPQPPTLTTQSFVRLEGITHRRSVSGDRVFFKLIGEHVYVEKTEVDDRPRVLRGMPQTPDVDTEVRPAFTEPGRLIAFSDLPARYEPFIEYYANGYGVHFCGFEPSDAVRIQLSSQRQRAELELADELGRRPSEQEVLDRFGERFACQDAWLVIAGQTPVSLRWMIGVYAVFLGIIAGCLWFVVRWYRNNFPSDAA
jgi:hypothetical protein